MDSALARKKLGSQTLSITRTTPSVLEVKLNGTAEPALELLFTITTITLPTDETLSTHSVCSNSKSTYIVSASDDSQLRNHREARVLQSLSTYQ
jgi:hypothetical protein